MSIFILCITVFFSRVVDVTLATLRSINNVKGKNLTAASIGMVEATIWFLVVRKALDGGDNLLIAVAFALGFSVGTYVGGRLAKILIKTKVQVQIVTSIESKSLISTLRGMGYAVTVVDVKKSEFSEEKLMLFVEIDSSSMTNIKKIIKETDEKAFIMIHESKEVHGGHFNAK